MTTIWKYDLETTDVQDVKIPVGSTILCIQTQFGKPCIWVEVPMTIVTNELVTIEIFGTGHPMSDEPRQYIGTYQLNNGELVFHCFKRL